MELLHAPLGQLDGDRFGLEAAIDGGSTWTAHLWPSVPDGTGGVTLDNLVRLSFVTPTTGWVFMLFGRLYETGDGGAPWHQIQAWWIDG